MKWIYVGIVNSEIIAFHDKKDIMSIYLRNYKDTNPADIVSLGKMKKKEAKSNIHYETYWLVPCNETYVQSEYEDILCMISSDYQEKVVLIDKLNQILSRTTKKSDKMVLVDTIRIIELNKTHCGTYTPSLNVLNEEYWRIQSYQNKMFYGG